MEINTLKSPKPETGLPDVLPSGMLLFLGDGVLLFESSVRLAGMIIPPRTNLTGTSCIPFFFASSSIIPYISSRSGFSTVKFS